MNPPELSEIMSTINKNLILSGAILASIASSSFVQAAPFALEARSLGMGNASVAMADIATAALANPAMLSYQQAKEDFSLLSLDRLIFRTLGELRRPHHWVESSGGDPNEQTALTFGVDRAAVCVFFATAREPLRQSRH